MRYWYEHENGFMKVTGIPYDRLGCKHCHAKSCDTCHAIQKNGISYFSASKAKEMHTCFKCHPREAIVIKKGKKGVHFAAGMECMDCHFSSDIHGTGILYKSMRDNGAVIADCMRCHKEGGDAPTYNSKIKAHRVHKGRLDCTACHVSASITCYNCHFQRVLETKKKKGNFIPMNSFLLLINCKGKVTAGNVMALVYKGKKFIAYVPYFTHSIMAEGRKCSECHRNSAMRLIKEGKKVPVVSYKDGRIIAWKGIVPCAPDKLEWTFFDKEKEKWVPMKGKEKEIIQFAVYGRPLTEKQLRMLMIPFGRKKK